jgi:hypothetical protein
MAKHIVWGLVDVVLDDPQTNLCFDCSIHTAYSKHDHMLVCHEEVEVLLNPCD